MQNFRPFLPCVFQEMRRNLDGRTGERRADRKNGQGWANGTTDRRTKRWSFGLRTDGRPENIMPPVPKGEGIKTGAWPRHWKKRELSYLSSRATAYVFTMPPVSTIGIMKLRVFSECIRLLWLKLALKELDTLFHEVLYSWAVVCLSEGQAYI